jgi:hypothetical protein
VTEADFRAAVLRELRAIRLAVEGRAYRDRLICELAAAMPLGVTWAGAQAVSLILSGARPAPLGAEAVAAMLAGCRLSARQVLRVLQASAASARADKSAALCQWPPPRDDRATDPDDDEGHADEE